MAQLSNGTTGLQIRYRINGRDAVCKTGGSLVGHVVSVAAESFVIDAGRGMLLEIALDDIIPALESRTMASGLLVDAKEHNDSVKFAVTQTRITYDNEAQLKRFIDLSRK